PCPQSVLVVRSTPPPLRILPSFPTRRSSDLEEVTGSIPVSRTEQAPGTPPGASCIPRRPRGADERATCGCCVAGLAREHYAERRSEEHTSELQSRFDLVCRLLLEKKNMNY